MTSAAPSPQGDGRVWPNFFIVGAAKAGTTSLWAYLRQHPDIYMPETDALKEPAFFSELKWIKSLDAYLRIFEKGRGRRAVGEASTAYLTCPESAARLRESCPDARIVIILRNPADRAFSLYNWMIREGYEWIEPFERALEEEDRRAADEAFHRSNPQYFYNYLYFRSGLYAGQVARYLDLFPRERILFLLFDDLKRDAVGATRRLCEFLGVSSDFSPEPEVFNPARVPYSAPMQCRIRRATHAMGRVYFPRVEWIKKAGFAANLALGKGKPTKLGAALRAELLARYESDIAKTGAAIGRDLSHWGAPRAS